MPSLPPRPVPDDEYQAAAWAHTSMRYDMMTGDWQVYADTRMGEFFAPEVRQFLPPAEISGNPALTITIQMATLYDEPVKLRAHDDTGEPVPDETLDPLQQSSAWSLMQDVLESVCGLNDCFVQVNYSAGQGLGWKIARPHEVEVEPDPQNPSQPARVRHLELSRRPGLDVAEWTWTTWVKDNPGAFKVEAVIQTDKGEALEDVTRLYYPVLPESKFPFMDKRGLPIWPWVAYHRRVSQRVVSPYAGREAWSGTLSFACLRTYWLAGVRDGAHPQRWGLDVDVQLAGTVDVGGGGKGAQVVRMNQLGVLMFQSVNKEGHGGQLGQFEPAMEPKTAGEAIAAFGAELAVYAGVAPQDVSIGGGTTGQSGYAITLSRDGQRRARRKLMVPMERGDRLRLSIEARMLNAYTTGPQLPEDPDAYLVEYAELEQTPEERRADREEAVALREAGVLGKVDFYLKWHPGLTREQAIADLKRNAAEDAEISAAAPVPAATPPPSPPTVMQTTEV